MVNKLTEETLFKKVVAKETVQITLLFFLAIVIVYYTPTFIKRIVFLVPLVLYWKSKREYFWFAFIFVLINPPCFLFINNTVGATNNLPLYTIISDFSFSIFDLFLVLSILKTWKRKGGKLKLSKPLIWLLIYFIFISLPLTFALGTDLSQFFNAFRSFCYYFILYTYFKSIHNIDEIFKFGYLLLPFILLEFINQIYVYITGSLLLTHIDNSTTLVSISEGLIRESRLLFSGFLISFYALIFGFQLFQNKKYEYFRGLSVIIISLVVSMFFLTATRAWFIIVVTSIFVFLILNPSKIRALLLIIAGGVLSFNILMYTNVIQHNFIESIFNRLGTTITIATTRSVDKTDSFNNRIEEDIPKLMEGIENSPVFGVGLSKYYVKHYSNDVGFINTVLIYGIVGFIIFLIFYIHLVYGLYQYSKSANFSRAERSIFLSMLAGFLGIFIGYIFTQDFFSYYNYKIYFISIMLATAESVCVINKKNRLLNSNK